KGLQLGRRRGHGGPWRFWPGKSPFRSYKNNGSANEAGLLLAGVNEFYSVSQDIPEQNPPVRDADISARSLREGLPGSNQFPASPAGRLIHAHRGASAAV